MSNKKISRKNLPAKLPVTATWLSILTMHYFDVPGWVWGSVIAIFVIIWIAAIWVVIEEKHIDLFKDGKL